jgi:uncharacterized protein (DUF302 family)
MSDVSDDALGFVQIQSRDSVAATGARLESLLKSSGVTLFARIDFSGDAARAGLMLHPETLFIFGNPKAGTPMMVARPSVGLDLPFKALLWEDADGHSWAAYNDPGYIVRRHALPPMFAANLTAAVSLIERACHE